MGEVEADWKGWMEVEIGSFMKLEVGIYTNILNIVKGVTVLGNVKRRAVLVDERCRERRRQVFEFEE